MIQTPLVIKAMLGLTLLSAIFEVAPPIDSGMVSEVSKLGVTGLLAVAVLVLWRSLQTVTKAKDDIMMANYKSMADALASNKAVMEKMADTLHEIREQVEKLATVRSALDRFSEK